MLSMPIARRSEQPFIVVDCASIPEMLLESTLFGHEKGAFTGAAAAKPGMLELASSGTLFLDEIGELPLPLQAKLLRAIQQQSFYRVGGVKEIQVDLRWLAATNRNLEELVRKGGFREDLYYRLKVITIEVPPLRQRQEDIPIWQSLSWLSSLNGMGSRRFSWHLKFISVCICIPGRVIFDNWKT